jgi:chromosome segregation ATPase
MSDPNERQEWEDFFTKGIETIAGQRYEIERLTTERDTAEAILERLQNKFAAVTAENEEHIDAFQRLFAERNKLQADYNEAREEVTTYSLLLDEAQARVKELEGDLNIMRLQRDATHVSRCPKCSTEQGSLEVSAD